MLSPLAINLVFAFLGDLLKPLFSNKHMITERLTEVQQTFYGVLGNYQVDMLHEANAHRRDVVF